MWEIEVKFCGTINKREIVSKWFLCCSCLVLSFVYDCKTAKLFQNQGEQKFGQIRARSKTGLKFDISRLCSQPFNSQWHCEKNTGQCFCIKSKATCKNSAHLDDI